MIRRKVGIGVICFVLLVACYVIEQNAREVWSRQMTYGEYEKTEKDKKTVEVTVGGDSKTADILLENEVSKVEQGQVKKIAYLTFDDGPSENTKIVLEALKKYNIHATFFMIANEITEERESLVKSMVKEGHLIGVHTYNHEPQEMYANKQACMQDFLKAYTRLKEVTGIAPTIYRFPYGSANCYMNGFCNDIIREMDERNMTFYDWNVTAEDSVGNPSEYSILKNISSFSKYNEPVILMHDGSSNKLTAKLLPQIIEKIKAAGYEFDTLDHRSNPFQWPHNWKKD